MKRPAPNSVQPPLTRAQAIDLDIITDLSDPEHAEVVAKTGVKLPLGITYSAYAENVGLEKTLFALQGAMRHYPEDKIPDEVYFSLQDKNGERVDLKYVRELDDDGKPVGTIMTLEEFPVPATGKTFMTTSFGKAQIWLGHYEHGGAPAVELFDEALESITMLSLNLPEQNHLLGPKEFFAKTYSENEEIAMDALRSGLFQDTGRRGGFMKAPIWRIQF